jgi:hypothetical protein
VVRNLRAELEPTAATWPLQKDAIARGVHYTGPHFISCDHGCAHGPHTHGRGDDCSGNSESAQHTVDLCLKAIQQSTAMFAWLDDPTAHGTLIEIGYAKALNIPIVISTPPARQAVVVRSSLGMPQRHRSEMWFALTSADVHIEAATPQPALAEAISALDDWAPA